MIGHQIWELEKISRGLRDNSKHRYIDRRIRKCPHPVEEEFSDLWFFLLRFEIVFSCFQKERKLLFLKQEIHQTI